jgi:phage terminase large subunit-like protein
MRFCAENVEVKTDDRGNFWPAKPNAKNKYAGKRGAKIDGIAALVNALTEARRYGFPTIKKKWSGGAFIV